MKRNCLSQLGIFLATTLLLGACGQQSGASWKTQAAGDNSGSDKSPLAAAAGYGFNRPRRGTTSTYGSGTTGNQVTQTASSVGTGVTRTSNPVSNKDFYGRQRTGSNATRPEDCAQAYNQKSRIRGNLRPALAKLATCLNHLVVKNNEELYKQLLILKQNADREYLSQRNQMFLNYSSQVNLRSR
ncbi:hypothetical protein EBR03_00705 [bacterium]|nr:hypothetical protein [bacterium]NBX83775.1 hypothetical protein [bacterium]